MPSNIIKTVDRYLFYKLLGKGAFGEVYEAIDSNIQEKVAVKVVNKSKLKEHNGLVG